MAGREALGKFLAGRMKIVQKLSNKGISTLAS